MKIRDLTEADFDRIREIYRERKYEFQLPDPKHPLVLIKKGLIDDEKLVMAAFARLQLNAFLIVDGKWKTPIDRLEGVELIEEAMISAATAFGLDEGSIQVSKRFGQRLEALGWKQGLGVTYTREF